MSLGYRKNSGAPWKHIEKAPNPVLEVKKLSWELENESEQAT